MGMVPLLVALRRASLRMAAWLGLIAGLGWVAVAAIPWLYAILRNYLELPPAGAVVLAIVIGELHAGLWWVPFSVIAADLCRRSPVAMMLGIPAVWALLEVARSELPGAVPWLLLGDALVEQPSLIQAAALLGAPAISFVLVALNLSVAQVLAGSARERSTSLAIATVLVGSALVHGQLSLHSLRRNDAQASRHRIVAVQGDVPRRAERRPRTVVNRYLALSRRAPLAGAALLVWPENAMPLYLQDEPGLARRIGRFLRRRGVPALLLGGPRYGTARPRRFFDAAFLLDQQGRVGPPHDKRWLVPGAETRVPGIDLPRPFTPGERAVSLPSPIGRLGVMLCYEAVFPRAGRELVGASTVGASSAPAGAEVLLNLSNDVWVGPAEPQLVAMARMQAIVNRRDLVRVANQGTSFAVGADGRTLAERPRKAGAGALVVDLTRRSGRTLAARHPRFGALLWGVLTVFCLALPRTPGRG